jgi:hypothetical protein
MLSRALAREGWRKQIGRRTMRQHVHHLLFHVDRMEASISAIELHSIHQFICMSRLRLQSNRSRWISCLAVCHCVSSCIKAVLEKNAMDCSRSWLLGVGDGSKSLSKNYRDVIIIRPKIRRLDPTRLPVRYCIAACWHIHSRRAAKRWKKACRKRRLDSFLY